MITPADLLFENDSRTRSNYSGSISKINNFQLRALGRLSYDLPLNANETVITSPEISYSLGLMDAIQTDKWKINSLHIGLALKYAWYKYPELIEPTLDKPFLPEPEAPELTLKRIVISGSAHGVFIDSDGNPAKAQILDIKNITSTNVAALVNYIFFEDSSAVIPPRYTLLNRGEVENFHLKDLEGTGTLPIYYNILNVIGNRMQIYPDASITLTGCLSGGDTEKDNPQLSKNRVDAVKGYLTDTWGIDPKRIAAKHRGTPEVPSNVKNEDGLAENRRVEITSKTWEILDVLSFNDTVRQFSAPVIALSAEVKAELGIDKWVISASQDKKMLKQFKGVSDIPSEKFLWDLVKEPQSTPKMNEPISLAVEVTDREGNKSIVKGEPIKIKQFYDQKERIETFSLIIFGFNMSSVNESNQRILEMIKGRITPKSIVTVTGFTDRTGAADYNQKLSDRRAKEIGKMLKVQEDKSEGKGGSELLYDNDLPEGRFYCRTVRVTVETPIE
ncbi:MAG: OmpA family protein [Ignavibacteriae bacterium]|nr:OmpA family protein [Ignavibacteriota bacterium]